MRYRSKLLIIIGLVLLQTAVSAQTISVAFKQYCENAPLEINRFKYTTQSGTKYAVSEVQYFVSDFVFYHNGNKIIAPTILYVDVNDERRLGIQISENTKLGKNPKIDSIQFVFGFTRQRNKNRMFRNGPESKMFWPEQLGGGYHYMKLNLKYIDNQDSVSLFNCHLGRGTEPIPNSNSHTVIDNDFLVTIPCSIPISKRGITPILIRMDIDQWFKEPNVIDFNKYSGGIMDNQKAMSEISENGKNAFRIITQ